jgi:hypothetical protein
MVSAGAAGSFRRAIWLEHAAAYCNVFVEVVVLCPKVSNTVLKQQQLQSVCRALNGNNREISGRGKLIVNCLLSVKRG